MEIPSSSAGRAARLASLPIGYAGRATLGLGRRLGGAPAEAVNAEVQRRTAEQLFKVLGQLKGGAMKMGQALSVMEPALPEELIEPYREALVKLQEAAPPMARATIRRQLARELGPHWHTMLHDFDETPAAAASIGQVHRARWKDGRQVAVKIQYPGAGEALMADFRQLSRLARAMAVAAPGLDMEPLMAELQERVAEEVDYGLEAHAQQAFARAFAEDPQIHIPRVLGRSNAVLVTEWVDGTPLSEIIRTGDQAERDRAGELLSIFHFSSPTRARMLHADPHPGNFRIAPDGRLVVFDFGATARLPDGPHLIVGQVARAVVDEDSEAAERALRAGGFIKPEVDVNAEDLLDYLGLFVEPLRSEHFHFTRAWMRGLTVQVSDPRSPANRVGMKLNMPPSYLLIHRVTLGSVGVLCQLEADVAVRGIMERWQPGFAPEPTIGP